MQRLCQRCLESWKFLDLCRNARNEETSLSMLRIGMGKGGGWRGRKGGRKFSGQIGKHERLTWIFSTTGTRVFLKSKLHFIYAVCWMKICFFLFFFNLSLICLSQLLDKLILTNRRMIFKKKRPKTQQKLYRSLLSYLIYFNFFFF